MSEGWDGQERRAVMADSAIVIRDIWGKVLTGVLLMAITGGFGFAFAQGTTNAEIKAAINGIEDLGDRRDLQLDRLDAKIDDVRSDVNVVRDQQIKMDAKLDLLLQEKKFNDRFGAAE